MIAKEAMTREINAVENEFQGNQQEDNCRMWQVIAEQAPSDHLISTFAWGNFKSLLGEGKKVEDVQDALYDDLRQFHASYYGPARMSLTVQVKTEDNMAQVKKWCIDYFSGIPAKNELLMQDFRYFVKPGFEKVPASLMPFNPKGMTIMNSIQD